jgi:hypothetical protein
LLKSFRVWQPIPEFESTYETAGGPLKVWIYSKKCLVKVLAEDRESKGVLSDLVIPPIADEVLLSDKLIGELELALEDVAKGLWRFR